MILAVGTNRGGAENAGETRRRPSALSPRDLRELRVSAVKGML